MVRTSLCWFRRDLRLEDHAALSMATAESQQVLPVFIFDSSILEPLPRRNDRRVAFIWQSLLELKSKLESHGSTLLILHGRPEELIPKLAEAVNAEAVFASESYQEASLRRDQNVYRSLEAAQRKLITVHDSFILRPGEVLTQAGTPFSVFTPFKRAWLTTFTPERAQPRITDIDRLMQHDAIPPYRKVERLQDIGFEEMFVQAGEVAAQNALARFSVRMADYRTQRDFPASDGTSLLSPHLRFGNISIRACVRAALKAPGEGAEMWLSELIWREFYYHVYALFEHRRGKSFKPEYDSVEWPGTDEHFQAWCEGRTGYPIVDAAMRSFNETGWMHNRLRMIVASFLVKDLLVDWRKGEEYFAQGLLDFELSSNNGGWQWSSSTGCDAQPYFRIFNPLLQSQKFDPHAEFIRKWCPELAGFSDDQIHAPWMASDFDQIAAGCIVEKDYPGPIVDHQTQKAAAIRLLESGKSGSV